HVFEREGAELLEDLAPDLCAVDAVPGQLEQVIINLVTNAIHAVGDGGQVAVRSFAADDNRVAIAIADNGPGIPVGDRDRIFEPFFTTKADGRGTGLGLSIVKNIVDLHGGEIRIGESDLGGAEILVLLPAHMDA
ncbi:MAG TPA: ATP-binding protein, partial [Kofleriaceae bacterium]|nr:ATP-binding protein [Kofleriaceae bacterium]